MVWARLRQNDRIEFGTPADLPRRNRSVGHWGMPGKRLKREYRVSGLGRHFLCDLRRPRNFLAKIMHCGRGARPYALPHQTPPSRRQGTFVKIVHASKGRHRQKFGFVLHRSWPGATPRSLFRIDPHASRPFSVRFDPSDVIPDRPRLSSFKPAGESNIGKVGPFRKPMETRR